MTYISAVYVLIEEGLLLGLIYYSALVIVSDLIVHTVLTRITLSKVHSCLGIWFGW